MRAVAMLVLAVSTITACASPAAHLSSGVAPDESPIMVRVDNRNYNDMTIYVVHDGVRSRLERVSAASSIVLRLPHSLIGQTGLIQLVAAPLGVHGGILPSFSSERLLVSTASRIEWTLEDRLERSSVGVY